MKTKGGGTLSSADVDRLSSRADAGFELSGWKTRRGRPALDASSIEHAPRITVRLPEPLHRRVVLRAQQEGRAVSDVVRSLLTGYAARSPSGAHADETASGAHAVRGVTRASTATKTGKAASSHVRTTSQ